AGRNDEPIGVDGPVCFFLLRGDLSVRNENIPDFIPSACRVDHPPAFDQQLHQFPATMDITAMRTAMPKVTCGRITECGPSATDEAISTPRFIGPGCMTIASGLARASLSSVRP